MENENANRPEQKGGEKKPNNKHYYNKNRRRKNHPHPQTQKNEKELAQTHVSNNAPTNDSAPKEERNDTQKNLPEANTHNQGNNNQRNHNKNHRNNQRRNNNRKNRPPHPVDAEQSKEMVENAEYLPEVVNEIAEHSEEIDVLTEEAHPEPVVEENSTVTEEAHTEELVEIIGVRFKVGGKTYYFSPNGITGRKGEHVIVETARGLEFGEIAVSNSMVSESEFVPPLRPVIRIATDADVKHHDDNAKKQDEAFRICNEKIIAHELDMKLIDAQYTFDNTKLLFYFTSAGRVDFRELVKDLAAVFKTRIELRQIGIRDEAKIIGGLGICGRPLCCSKFLSDFGQVSIKMAKEQNLSLNSAKISGACGRLMCCLRYEYDTYVQEIKNTPPVDAHVKTPDGTGIVTEIMPLAGNVKVRLDDKPDVPPRVYSRDQVTILPKQKQ